MAKAIKYEIGDKHRHWTIIGHAGLNNHAQRLVKARCTCGFEAVMILSLLRTGKSKYCRVCVKKRFENYEYKQAKEQYGKLKVIRQQRGSCEHKNVLVRCDCGTEYFTSLSALDSGNTTSCELCGANAHKQPRNKPKPRKKKAKQPEALQMRASGVCRKDGLCKYYRDCGDKLFNCSCRGWRIKVPPLEAEWA